MENSSFHNCTSLNCLFLQKVSWNTFLHKKALKLDNYELASSDFHSEPILMEKSTFHNCTSLNRLFLPKVNSNVFLYKKTLKTG